MASLNAGKAALAVGITGGATAAVASLVIFLVCFLNTNKKNNLDVNSRINTEKGFNSQLNSDLDLKNSVGDVTEVDTESNEILGIADKQEVMDCLGNIGYSKFSKPRSVFSNDDELVRLFIKVKNERLGNSDHESCLLVYNMSEKGILSNDRIKICENIGFIPEMPIKREFLDSIINESNKSIIPICTLSSWRDSVIEQLDDLNAAINLGEIHIINEKIARFKNSLNPPALAILSSKDMYKQIGEEVVRILKIDKGINNETEMNEWIDYLKTVPGILLDNSMNGSTTNNEEVENSVSVINVIESPIDCKSANNTEEDINGIAKEVLEKLKLSNCQGIFEGNGLLLQLGRVYNEKLDYNNSESRLLIFNMYKAETPIDAIKKICTELNFEPEEHIKWETLRSIVTETPGISGWSLTRFNTHQTRPMYRVALLNAAISQKDISIINSCVKEFKEYINSWNKWNLASETCKAIVEKLKMEEELSDENQLEEWLSYLKDTQETLKSKE